MKKKDEAATYSSACGSTIGAKELNGRVRNGNGWDLLAGPPHQRWLGQKQVNAFVIMKSVELIGGW